ncbi:MAG: DEAD/DEAH box helicase [Candidatus Caldatribacterium sp.]|nr:DEAD/DEAH box helicase [Candidatus Caldatribacterium sp.]
MDVGSIVRFRNRDWVVVSEGEERILLRPLTGTSDEVVAVHRRLCNLLGYTFPSERLSPSQFPLPKVDSVADAQSVLLLWQAGRLLLREGAAPFRSFGRISIRPRTYQLVPLMMALRLHPVRLLVADDVGVGKTVEAGLIVRELWDRGEIRRLAVLCPPYLCDWWQKELEEKFHLEAVVIGSGTIASLERQVPPGRTVYEHFPVQVISIDFVKHSRNASPFLLSPPDLVIVDEAHGVVPGRGMDRHLRYELVKELASDPKRHLILLTATPHSGIPEAFQKLLGLLDPRFEGWKFTDLTEAERAELARHFVQRTRRDIEEQWKDGSCFPKREPVDATYRLSPAYRRLFEAVYDFCTEIVQSGKDLEEHRRRMRWWSALALLRCVMSSPRAAQVALRKRRRGEEFAPEEDEEDIYYAFEPDNRTPNEEVPTPLLERVEADLSRAEKDRLRRLEEMASGITEEEDTKLQGCVEEVRKLLREGYHPVIWCFYVETAEYVAEALQRALAGEFPDAHVLCLTGRIGEEERRLKVKELMQKPRRVLVATDCLSEGVNLQEGFNAVLHYDLPWNPNRLEQREGRVDRYGQKTPVVKAIRYYGVDNPVDGAVIGVLLNKAREIRKTLGTYVPIPEEEQLVVETLVHALFFREEQMSLPFAEPEPQVEELHKRWDLDVRREKENRTRFAQRALKPEEVERELEATDRVLGDPEAVRNFVLLTCQKLGITLEKDRRLKGVWHVILHRASLAGVPEVIRRALPDSGERWTVSFESPTPEGAEYIGRNHPFVTALARYVFEEALEGKDEAVASRCGAIRTRAVRRLTSLLLVRPRFQLRLPDRPPLLAEEVVVVGFEGFGEKWLSPNEALPLLHAEPSSNLPEREKRELVAMMRDEVQRLLEETQDGNPLRTLLERRAQELEEAHRRVRQSVGQRVRGLGVQLHWPPDILGLLVLQPEVGA